MKKILIAIFALAICGAMSAPLAIKATSDSATTSVQQLLTTLQAQIAALKAQIAAMTAQLESLRQAKDEVKEAAKDVKTTLQLIRNLKEGMSGDDIKTLQELLATDPDIYPQGLITGYYGKFTIQAVKRLQKKFCLDQVGHVGPQTMAKINELLTEGAGKSGKIPAGLLRAPGIIKKFCASTTPATTTPDTTAPVISEVTAMNITANAAKIKWTTNELSNSTVMYNTAANVLALSNSLFASSSAYAISHNIFLTNLTPTTTYYYVVKSVDKSGNPAFSGEGSFTTAGL